MLTLPIKKKWFDMILSGEKKEEYREKNRYYRFGGRTVKQVLKLCRECRTELKEHGYNLREDEILPESIEDCELCGLHTAVKRCTIEKGERKG